MIGLVVARDAMIDAGYGDATTQSGTGQALSLALAAAKN